MELYLLRSSCIGNFIDHWNGHWCVDLRPKYKVHAISILNNGCIFVVANWPVRTLACAMFDACIFRMGRIAYPQPYGQCKTVALIDAVYYVAVPFGILCNRAGRHTAIG